MMRRQLIASTAVAFCVTAVVAPASAQETMRVRGIVEKVDGSTLMEDGFTSPLRRALESAVIEFTAEAKK